MKVDVRNLNKDSIDSIVFADSMDFDTEDARIASLLCLDDKYKQYIFIHADCESLAIRKRDVNNVIEALQLAIQYGWNK